MGMDFEGAGSNIGFPNNHIHKFVHALRRCSSERFALCGTPALPSTKNLALMPVDTLDSASAAGRITFFFRNAVGEGPEDL